MQNKYYYFTRRIIKVSYLNATFLRNDLVTTYVCLYISIKKKNRLCFCHWFNNNSGRKVVGFTITCSIKFLLLLMLSV